MRTVFNPADIRRLRSHTENLFLFIKIKVHIKKNVSNRKLLLEKGECLVQNKGANRSRAIKTSGQRSCNQRVVTNKYPKFYS